MDIDVIKVEVRTDVREVYIEHAGRGCALGRQSNEGYQWMVMLLDELGVKYERVNHVERCKAAHQARQASAR